MELPLLENLTGPAAAAHCDGMEVMIGEGLIQESFSDVHHATLKLVIATHLF